MNQMKVQIGFEWCNNEIIKYGICIIDYASNEAHNLQNKTHNQLCVIF